MQSRITYGNWRLQICQPRSISSTFAPQTWKGRPARGIALRPLVSARRQCHDTPDVDRTSAEGNEQNQDLVGRIANRRTLAWSISHKPPSMADATRSPTQTLLARENCFTKGAGSHRCEQQEQHNFEGREPVKLLAVGWRPHAQSRCSKHHSDAPYSHQRAWVHTSSKVSDNDRMFNGPNITESKGQELEKPTKLVFKGLQVRPSARAKLIRQKFAAKPKTTIRPAITSPSMKRTNDFLDSSGIPKYSELEFKRMRSSPSIIIHALKRGRLTPKARNFNFAAWSKEDSATAMAMRHLLAMKTPEIIRLRTEARDAVLAPFERPASGDFRESFLARLNKRDYADEDIQEWTKIALAPDNARALLYLDSSCAIPPHAVFNEVLRKSSFDVRTLRKMVTSCRLTLAYSAERRSVAEAGTMQDNQFIFLFSILMQHARHIAPSLLPKSIAPLIVEYCQLLVRQESSRARLAERLHRICNTAVVRFGVTPKRHPMHGMDYAWVAQAKILELGDAFSPSLVLEAATYRAIIRVLLACKKTEWEEHAVTHLLRTWPPWRRTQDGMDARIQPDDELTRVVSVVQNLIRAGHPRSSFDKMAMILGGRDIDGTPTIPTRTILKARYDKEAYDPTSTNTDLEWAARVRATRDIREAWGAFRACERRGQKPTQGMFEEMIEKLVWDTKREGGARSTPRIPGAGKEVAIYRNDNLSETELQRVNPPSVDELLALMKSSKIKLSQKSLCLLIRGAWSPRYARNLMLDYGVDEKAVMQLSRGRRAQKAELDKSIHELIPEKILTAYVQLLCRFSAYKWLPVKSHSGRRHGMEYLPDVVHILKFAPEHREAWHTFIKTVALIKKNSGQTTYDFSSSAKLWMLLHEALEHRRTMNLVDADHFGYACYGLYNALEGEEQGYHLDHGVKQEGITFLNNFWSYLSDVPLEEQRDFSLPVLLHDIRGWHLHAYVRLLARTKQKEQIAVILNWMAAHANELDSIALSRANGLVGLRRTLIAMRTYSISTRDVEYENELREMADGIVLDWGGWASDREVEEYLAYVSEAEDSREIDADVRLGHGIVDAKGRDLFESPRDKTDIRQEASVGPDGTVLYRPI